MKGQSYIDELAGVVALPGRMDGSLIDFARRIRVQIESELSKISPDNTLIALLADAARLGWEQIEWANAPLDTADRLLNVPTTYSNTDTIRDIAVALSELCDLSTLSNWSKLADIKIRMDKIVAFKK